MTDDHAGPGGVGPDARPKRQPPTIDLDASEVSDKTESTNGAGRRAWPIFSWLARALPVVAGAVAGFVVVGMVWATGLLVRDATPPSEISEISAAINELSGRVGRIEGKVQRGEPFADVLSAAKSIAADSAGLAPLDAFTTSGVPTEASLARELLALVPRLTPARATSDNAASGNAGLLDRLAAGAGKLVRIERADTPGASSVDPGGLLRSVADAARRNDLSAAR